MPGLKHIHTYERIKGKPHLYRCSHPDCSHYVKKELLNGKRALCVCGREYFMSLQMLRLKKPHCEYCTRSAKAQERIATLEKMFKEQEERPELELPQGKDPFNLNF